MKTNGPRDSKRRTRVCYVVNNFNVGGLEKVVLSLLNHLDRERYDLSLVCLDGKGALFDDVDPVAVRTLVLDKDPQIDFLVAKVNVEAIAKLRAFLRDERIDIVHAHNLSPLVYAGLAARSLPRRPRVVYSEHNQIYKSSEAQRRKFRFYLKLADHVVTVSRDLKHFFERELGIHRKIEVLYNGIDGARFSPNTTSTLRESLGIPADAPLVGTAVVLSEQKGITYLLRAIERVLAKRPNAHFAIAGDGPLRASLEAEAVSLGIAPSVHFLGFRRDVASLIAAYDVYVLSSLWEGLPLALIEALACGKPAVATTVGGNGEIVIDGENGRLVPPRDPEALARAIDEVLGDQALREAVRTRNVERFERCFSLDAMIEGHCAFYDRVMRERSSAAELAAPIL